MMKFFNSFIFLLILLIISSCSSVKNVDLQIINEKHNKAAEYAQLGTNFFC